MAASAHDSAVIGTSPTVSLTRFQVTAEDIAAIGTAEIRVTNPTPGGGMSNGKTLVIQ